MIVDRLMKNSARIAKANTFLWRAQICDCSFHFFGFRRSPFSEILGQRLARLVRVPKTIHMRVSSFAMDCLDIRQT